MALHPCYECGKEVSTSAKTCPHCGARAGVCKGTFCNKPVANKDGYCASCSGKQWLWPILAMLVIPFFFAGKDSSNTRQSVPRVAPNSTGILNSRVVACRSKAGADDLLDAAARVGDAAYQEKARQLVNSGQCSTFAPGAKCVVVDGSILGASKVYIGDRGPYYIHGASEFGCGAK